MHMLGVLVYAPHWATLTDLYGPKDKRVPRFFPNQGWAILLFIKSVQRLYDNIDASGVSLLTSHVHNVTSSSSGHGSDYQLLPFENR